MPFLAVLLSSIFLFSGAFAADHTQDDEFNQFNQRSMYRNFYPGDVVNQVDPVPPFQPVDFPRRDDFIGERTQVGDTWYDYQTNGSVGKMILVDQGWVHITWMDGYDSDMSNGTRHQKYNVFDPDRESWYDDDGGVIDNGSRGGYGSIALSNEENPRAIAFFHNSVEGGTFSMCGADWERGVGAFDNIRLPNYPESEVLWPQGVMSPGGRLHVVYNRREGERMLSYTQGYLNQESRPVFDADNPTGIDITHLNTYRIAQSPNSERAAITWMRSRVDNMDIHDFADWDGFLAYQMNNDLMLAWTDDGDHWNFENALNITDNIPPDPRQEGSASYGDTLRAFTTHDIIFDADDNIHVIFDARLLRVQAIPESQPPIDGLTLDYSYLFHWSEDVEEITAVADGWYSQLIYDENDEPILRPEPGAWKSNVCNPSMGFDADGNLYCVYNIFPYEDYSIRDICNSDVAVTVSTDNGRTWYQPTLITETHSLLADDGQHLCEVYPTLAETVDDYLHISYEMDTEPGSPIQNADVDMPSSLCGWYYHKLPVEDVLMDEIWDDGPSWHVDFMPIVNNIFRAPGVPQPEQEVVVSADVTATGGHELVAVELEYEVMTGEAGKQTIQMNVIGENTYTATIPAQEEGAVVWYHIRAVDSEDVETYRPEGWWQSYVVRPEGGLLIKDVQYRPVDWSVDFSPYKGYEVSLTGVVTSTAEFSDLYGAFSIQEADTFWSGILVRGVDEYPDEGALVRVTGIVTERDADDPDKWGFMTYVQANVDGGVEVLGNDDLIQPIQVELSDLVYSTHAEHLEGCLVETNRFEIDSTSAVNDAFRGIYWPITSGWIAEEETEYESWMTTYGLDIGLLEDDLDYAKWRQGTAFISVKGIFVENQAYAIAPRGVDDFGELGAAHEKPALPQKVVLENAYPNPFNGTTRVGFELSVGGFVHLGLYDLSGRLVATALEGEVNTGKHYVTLDASGFSTGVYVVRLETNNISASQKIVLVK